ncbi:MAG: hypothetical protein ACRENS_02835 [Candidatus Eiseniibacteriota bacterium]
MTGPARLILTVAMTIAVVQSLRVFAEPLRPPSGRPSAMPFTSAGCRVIHLGIDTVGANDFKDVFNSEGEGQVVNVQETQVTAFTVYLTAFANNSIPYFARLYVTNSDLNGRPVTSSVLYEGPIVQGPFGDGVHPLPWTFDISPPLTLSHPGLYYFNVTEGSCFIGTFWLLADTTNRYADGGEWRTGRSTCDINPGSIAGPLYPRTDLIFDVETCSSVTPTRTRSWGTLKILYR